MVEAVLQNLIIAKFFTLMALINTSKKYEYWGVIGSAILYTFIIMMFHLFIDALQHEFIAKEILIKTSVNFFPAIIYFWLLSWNSGYRYWLIFFSGLGYFLYISKYTALM